MNNHGVTIENLTSSFPDTLNADKRMQALSVAISEQLIKNDRDCAALNIYTAIDDLPEELLDILAYDFKVDWWDPNYTLEEKRATLKESWKVHRGIGTKTAVETALSVIYPNTKVVEWFKYGGRPHHFKLQIIATFQDISTEKHHRVMKRLSTYKRLTSILDAIEYYDDCVVEKAYAGTLCGNEIIDGAIAAI